VIVLSFGARSHFSFIAWMFYNTSMFVVLQKNNNSIDVLFTVCAADHYYVKIVDKFQSEIRMPNVCKSNLNSKFENSNFVLHPYR